MQATQYRCSVQCKCARVTRKKPSSKWAALLDYALSFPFPSRPCCSISELDTFPLMALPDDLLYLVVEAVDEQQDLCRLAQTCRKLNGIAEAQLYRRVNICKDQQALELRSAFFAKPARFDHVRDFCLCNTLPGQLTRSIRGSGGGVKDGESVPKLLKRMRKLRILSVETSTWSEHIQTQSMAEIMGMFRRANDITISDAPLRCLTSFTFYNRQYHDLTLFLPLITSRTLEYLSISCVELTEFNVSPSLVKSTPLHTLILDESFIHPTPLERLLSLPRALTSLSLGECVGYPSKGSNLNRNPASFLSALHQQNDSLEYLQHICHGFNPIRPQTPKTISQAYNKLHAYGSVFRTTSGLSSFAHLRTLELDWTSILTQVLESAHRAPPALHTYRLTSLAHVYEENWALLPSRLAAVVSATRLQNLELHTLPYVTDLYALHPTDRPLDSVVQLARTVKHYGVKISLFLYAPRWRSRNPDCRVIFDSEVFWGEEALFEEMRREESMRDGDGARYWEHCLRRVGFEPWPIRQVSPWG